MSNADFKGKCCNIQEAIGVPMLFYVSLEDGYMRKPFPGMFEVHKTQHPVMLEESFYVGDAWSKKHCLQDHYVYLSLTSNIKVGVTRNTQIPTRWIDQGAHYAIKFSKTPNRFLAGCIELEISKYISDRTQWRKMLQGDFEKINLIDKKKELSEKLPIDLQEYISNENKIVTINYPTYKNLLKIKSINLDKTPNVYGELTGIKGQYLIIDNNFVFNVRKYTGYILGISFSESSYNS